jgi:hypothetical protein
MCLPPFSVPFSSVYLYTDNRLLWSEESSRSLKELRSDPRLYNTWTIGAMSTASAQPQIMLILLRSISFINLPLYERTCRRILILCLREGGFTVGVLSELRRRMSPPFPPPPPPPTKNLNLESLKSLHRYTNLCIPESMV